MLPYEAVRAARRPTKSSRVSCEHVRCGARPRSVGSRRARTDGGAGMSDGGCDHIRGIEQVKHAESAAVRGVRQDRRALGAPAHVSDLRRHALLRLLAEPAREQARAHVGAPGHRVGRTGRTLALLLSGRRVRGVLASAGAPSTPIPVSTVFAGGSLAGNVSSSASSMSSLSSMSSATQPPETSLRPRPL